MMKMKWFWLLLILTGVACQTQSVEELYSCSDATVYDLGHSIRYQDIYGILDYEKFARSNHLLGTCDDDLIKGVFEIIDLISLAQSELDRKAGGIDVDGKLISACDTRIGGEILVAMEFNLRLAKALNDFSSQSLPSSLQSEMVERIYDDVRILTSEWYSGDSIYDRKVLEIFLDLNNAKMKLLFTETILFETLKSNGMC